ncbi:MAG: pitrilysin family protein [Candidatus Brocadiia bacterium]
MNNSAGVNDFIAADSKDLIFWTVRSVCDTKLNMFTTIKDILPGVTLHLHPTDKFKTIVAKLFVRQPLVNSFEATLNAMLLRVMSRGSGKFPSMRKMSVFMESLYGASFGSDISKIGEYSILEYYIEFLSPSFVQSRVLRSKMTQKAFGFIKDMLLNPLTEGKKLRPDYCKQEQQQLKDFIEGLFDDKMSFAEERCTQEMCKTEPYGIFEYGTIEDIARVTPELLYQHHRKVLVSAPIEIFAVGQFKPEQLAKAVVSILKPFKSLHKDIKDTKITIKNPPAPAEPRVIKENQPIDQGKLVMGLRTDTTWKDDDVFNLMVANGVLGGFPHSKLFRNVREKAGLAYFVFSIIERTKGLMMIKAGINHDKFDQAVAIIKEQIEALKQADIPDKELSDTKKSIITRLKSVEDTASAMINFYQELILNGRTGISIKDIIGRIDAVSKDDVAAAARKLKLDTIYFLTSNK